MAKIAVSDKELNQRIQVTPIRQQIVEMFEENNALELAGNKEELERLKEELKLKIKNVDELRRFNMDMAAFIWLFCANPKVKWYYLVGSDKVAGYGRKGEYSLVVETLGDPLSGVQKILYFARKDEDINYEKDIKPYDWMDKKWKEGLFEKSNYSSFEDISATKIRTALVEGRNEIEGIALEETVPKEVLTYMM